MKDLFTPLHTHLIYLSTHTHTHTFSLSFLHIHTLSLLHTHKHSLSFLHTHSLSLSRTQSHTNTHTQKLFSHTYTISISHKVFCFVLFCFALVYSKPFVWINLCSIALHWRHWRCWKDEKKFLSCTPAEVTPRGQRINKPKIDTHARPLNSNTIMNPFYLSNKKSNKFDEKWFFRQQKTKMMKWFLNMFRLSSGLNQLQNSISEFDRKLNHFKYKKDTHYNL